MTKTFDARSQGFRKKVADAALWMKKRHAGDDHFWRWPVLTAHNKDPDKRPIFDDLTAQQVFEDLENRGLLIEVKLPPDGSGARSFFMRYDVKGWDDVVVEGKPLVGWAQKINRDWVAYLVTFAAGCLVIVVENRTVGLIDKLLDWFISLF